jgi:hypothetical protein
MNGSAHFIKGEVVPLLDEFTIPLIEKYLTEISTHTNVKWFEVDGLRYIHALSFEKYQEIRKDRRGHDDFPDYSGRTPGNIPPEVEVEVEVEGEVEVLPIAPNPGASLSLGDQQANPNSKPKETPGQKRIRSVVMCFKAVSPDRDLPDAEWNMLHFARYSKPAKQLLTLFGNDVSQVADCIDQVVNALESKGLSWTPETIVKHAGTWKATGRVFQ